MGDIFTFAEGVSRNRQAGAVISKIEDILEHIIDALNENRVLTIPLRSRQSCSERFIRFPANTEAEVKRFMPRYGGSNLLSTSRNIYYQNPTLFGSQQYVDKLVDDIAFTFGGGRDVLNIVAASKGLIAGKIIATLEDGSELDCSSDSNVSTETVTVKVSQLANQSCQGILVPYIETIHQINICEVKWILVIEKELHLDTLRHQQQEQGFSSRYGSISITIIVVIFSLQHPQGKGYPDLLTRRFLHLLHSTFPRMPIYALVDFDPSGISIMLTYKFGSQSLRHEENVAVPGLSWLGPKSDDLLNHSYYRPSSACVSEIDHPFVSARPSSQETGVSSSSSERTLFTNPLQVSSPLTTSDRRKAFSLLRKFNNEWNQDANEMELVHELQLMLMLNLKVEIQAVDNAGDMTTWLDERLIEVQNRE
ncbi:endodeoxyribonuclease [Parahypoxylon ruwenzoriense]